MICRDNFGIRIIGRRMMKISNGRGAGLFLKTRRELTGAEARTQGLIAILIDAVIIAIFIFTNR